MGYFKKLSYLTIVLGLMSSCIKEEALNSEADIESANIEAGMQKRSPIIQNRKVTFFVKDEVGLTNLSPEFHLTEGATIEPKSGTTQDFTFPKYYTVTSQDKKWTKKYEVNFINTSLVESFNFENARTDSEQTPYHVFFEEENGHEVFEWSSGNAGFAFTGMATTSDSYPTYQSEDGYEGKCVTLVTRTTGDLGKMFGSPMAAGNLFMGSFQISLTNPVESTKFGLPYTFVPSKLSGYYKYTPGKEYTEGDKVVADKQDDFDIYAVFYETDEDLKTLDGTNALTHPNIVSIARVEERQENDEWIHFSIPFVMKEGKVIDKEKLANNGYNIAIVMTSSIHGDKFAGAVGSTLKVDNLQLFHNK